MSRPTLGGSAWRFCGHHAPHFFYPQTSRRASIPPSTATALSARQAGSHPLVVHTASTDTGELSPTPVDDALPLAAVSCSPIPEGIDKSARVAVGRQPGPRRTEGTDRLVDIMPARMDTAPPAICPLCREPALVTSTARREGAVVTGNYVCPNDHIWLERWTDLAGKD